MLTFARSPIQNSWASMLAAATRTIREHVLIKGSYTLRLYGILLLELQNQNIIKLSKS